MRIFFKAFIGLLFVLLLTAGVQFGLFVINKPGALAKIGGVLVFALTTCAACVGVYQFLGADQEDLS